MTRAMAILHQWDAAGRDIRSNGLAEGHNGAELSENPYFQLCRPGSHRNCRCVAMNGIIWNRTTACACDNGTIIPVKQIVDRAIVKTKTIASVIVLRRTNSEVKMLKGRDYWFHDLIQNISEEYFLIKEILIY